MNFMVLKYKMLYEINLFFNKLLSIILCHWNIELFHNNDNTYMIRKLNFEIKFKH